MEATKLLLEAIETHAEACQGHCPHYEAMNNDEVMELLHETMDSYAAAALEICQEQGIYDPQAIGRAMAMNALRAGIHIGYRLYQLEITSTAVADTIAKLESSNTPQPPPRGGIPGKECGS